MAAADASVPFDLNPSFLNKPGSLQAYEKLLNDTLEEPPESFGRKDMALLSLLCAPSLDGSENLNINKCLGRVDELTAWVKARTERGLPRFRNDPEHGHCEAMWRMGMLITVVKRDFGASYRPSVREEIESGNGVLFNDSKDSFIHGLLADDPSRRWGTCASLPVLVAAVARRLNYPVGLAVSGRHVYARWETGRRGGLVFNIEASGPAGMVIHTDEYYRESMLERGTGDANSSYYLRTLHPAEEFGLFLSMRVEHLIHGGRYEETLLWSARSLQFAPDDPVFPLVAQRALDHAMKWRLKLKHPETKIPEDLSKSFIFEVGDLLAVEERCLMLTIMGHYHEAKGELAEARTYYENACRQNFHGNNEQRDLQRFLRKYELPKRTDKLMPGNLGQPRRIQIKCPPEEEVAALRRLADQCERRGELVKARDTLHDLYLFDPGDAAVFQRARMLEETPVFRSQLQALVERARRELRSNYKVIN
jgi:tetratricopeptide (TPR) repeat protein